MKRIRTYLLLGSMLLAGGSIVAFTNMNADPNEKTGSCHLTITYEENGETVVLDTTFVCDSSPDVHGFIDALNLPKGSKIECKMECEATSCGKKGNKNSCSGMASADNFEIIKEIDEDGNEVMKVIIDGVELDIDGEKMRMMHEGDGERQMKMMIMKTDDGEGNLIVRQCLIGGEDCKMKCCEGKDRPSCCKKGMKFSEGEGDENIFVQVIDVDGVEKRCVVIIKSMEDHDETMLKREAPESVPNLEKSELEVNDLVFSPNPNDGHFNLSFELTETTPVKIAVYSMEGRKVYSQKIKQPEGRFSEEIDISKSGSGTYFLQITQGDKAQTKKVVIQ